MINLQKEQKYYIFSYNRGNLIIDGKKYFFKLIPNNVYGIETLVENLAKLVDIKCPHYEYVTINGLNYSLSEDIAGTGDFYTAYELGFFDNSLYDIWNVLEMQFPDKVSELMEKIIKIYIFDILLLNDDRNYGNYGFKVNDGKIEDVYIFDNEFSFQTGEVVLSSKLDFKDKLNKRVNIGNIPYELEPSIEELEYFLSTSSKEYIDLFNKIYMTLTPEVVKKELDKSLVEDKDSLYKIYRENYLLIERLINKRRLK